jgi:hypothetical protein
VRKLPYLAAASAVFFPRRIAGERVSESTCPGALCDRHFIDETY